MSERAFAEWFALRYDAMIVHSEQIIGVHGNGRDDIHGALLRDR